MQTNAVNTSIPQIVVRSEQPVLTRQDSRMKRLSRTISSKSLASLSPFNKSAVQKNSLTNTEAKIQALSQHVLQLKATTAREKANIHTNLGLLDNFQKLKIDEQLNQSDARFKSDFKNQKENLDHIDKKLEKYEAQLSKLSKHLSKAKDSDAVGLKQEVDKLEKKLLEKADVNVAGASDTGKKLSNEVIDAKMTALVNHCMNTGKFPSKPLAALLKSPALFSQFINTYNNVLKESGHPDAARGPIIPMDLLKGLNGSDREKFMDALATKFANDAIVTGSLPVRPEKGTSLEHQEAFGKIFDKLLEKTATGETALKEVGGGSGGVMKLSVKQPDGSLTPLFIIKAGTTKFKANLGPLDRERMESRGFKEGQEHLRELGSNVGFFGSRNTAIVNVPTSVFQAGEVGVTSAVVMDFAHGEGTLHDLMVERYHETRKLMSALADGRSAEHMRLMELPPPITKESLITVMANHLEFALKTSDGAKMRKMVDAFIDKHKIEVPEGQTKEQVIANMIKQPGAFNDSTPLSDDLANIAFKAGYYSDEAIVEAGMRPYDEANATKLEKARDLGINPDMINLSKQPQLLEKIPFLSLTQAVLNPVANRGDDSGEGNVILTKHGDQVLLSAIDAGETHSTNTESDINSYWHGVSTLKRPLNSEIPEELAYKNQILNLDVDQQVALFKTSIETHLTDKSQINDFAPYLYRSRMVWIKEAVKHELPMSEIADMDTNLKYVMGILFKVDAGFPEASLDEKLKMVDSRILAYVLKLKEA